MKFRHTLAVGICTLSLSFLSVASAQTKSGDAATVAAITRLENESIKAILGHPRPFLEKNYADDFIGGTSFGKWETKASILKDFDNPANKINSMSARDIKVSAYGNAAVARFTLAYDDVYNGEHRTRSVICTDTWIMHGTAWQQVASHCSQAK